MSMICNDPDVFSEVLKNDDGPNLVKMPEIEFGSYIPGNIDLNETIFCKSKKTWRTVESPCFPLPRAYIACA